MTTLTNKENKLYFKQKACYIWGGISTNDDKGIAFNEKYHKVRDHCYYIGKYRGTEGLQNGKFKDCKSYL